MRLCTAHTNLVLYNGLLYHGEGSNPAIENGNLTCSETRHGKDGQALMLITSPSRVPTGKGKYGN